TSANPYYPGNGSTPAVPGVTGQQVSVNWRTLPAGKRTNEPKNTAERVVGMLEGVLAGWDYQAAAVWNKTTTKEDFTDGYVKRPVFVAGLLGTAPGFAGVFLNPFNEPTAQEAALIQSGKVIGRVIDAKGEVKGADC